MQGTALETANPPSRGAEDKHEPSIENPFEPRMNLTAVLDRLDKVLGRGVEVDGQVLSRPVELGKDTPQRLGKGGGGVLHAWRLADPAAAPRVADP